VPKGILLKNIGLYLVAVCLMTYYGIEVCPFLDQIDVYELIVEMSVGLGGVQLIKLAVCRRMAPISDIDLDRPWRFLNIELATWVVGGLAVAAWNATIYEFPVESGLKVILGTATLGIFSATFLALDIERDTILRLSEMPEAREVDASRFLSITTKFMVFVGASIVLLAIVIVLLIYKDFTFVIESYEQMRDFKFAWVVREVIFVFGILLTGCFVATRKYGRNLRLMFDLQLKAFRSVEEGDFNTFVPVVSQDEFSRIAEHTNSMIAGLRERERIKSAFGKYVDASVAESILSHETETNLGGRDAEVAVLFTDLRDFTPYAERCTPQELLAILNQYFTMVVECVHRHNGILDKFIGDAAMAVYGLDRCPNPCEAALQTALEIRDGLIPLNAELEGRGLTPLRNGIGIHYGNVVAGNIGSEERLEYTVIGDAVNVASRLESATKELTSPLAISEEGYNRLEESTRSGLSPLGEVSLKGKSEPCPVYGIPGEAA
jgi:adenylate cyclase